MLQRPTPITDPLLRQRVAVVVALILLVSAGVRLYQLATPAQYMFDEVYYAKDAKAIVDGRVKPKDPLRWEAGDEVSWPHPEMGKFAIAAGIVLFGNRAFGWRLPAVLAGLLMLACVYPLARRLGLSPSWGLIALGFAAADPLGITQSRIATLDVFVAFWTVLTILLALRYAQDGRRRRWLFLCGLAGGMATATKWSGALALLAAAIILIIAWVRDRRPATAPPAAAWPAAPPAGASATASDPLPDGGAEATAAAGPTTAGRDGASLPQRIVAAVVAALPAVAALVAIPAAVYFLSYVQYFAAGHTWSDWVELQRQALYFNLHLKATHTYASPSYSWIIDYRPVWYYFQGGATYRGVIAMGNPFLWWLATLSLVVTAVLIPLRRAKLLLAPALMVVVLYFPWFAATRTSFLYYMTPVAPFMAILVAAGLATFAGTMLIPRHGIQVLAVAGVATAVLWDYVGRLCSWIFWGLPGRVGLAFSWVGLAVGLAIALTVVVYLLSDRLRPQRPFIALALAGMVIGIAVAFMPIVLNIPISPSHFSHITWFRSWI